MTSPVPGDEEPVKAGSMLVVAAPLIGAGDREERGFGVVAPSLAVSISSSLRRNGWALPRRPPLYRRRWSSNCEPRVELEGPKKFPPTLVDVPLGKVGYIPPLLVAESSCIACMDAGECSGLLEYALDEGGVRAGVPSDMEDAESIAAVGVMEAVDDGGICDGGKA